MSGEKDRLLTQGKRLMQGSGENRAGELELLLTTVTDRWQALEDAVAARLLNSVTIEIYSRQIQ